MGSSLGSCRISFLNNITLVGDRTTVSEMGTDPYDGTNLGTKGIAVATGGLLALWGRQFPVSWTKLAKTVYPGSKVLALESSTTWLNGSKIVLATSDFSDVVDSAQIAQTSSLAWKRGAAFPDQNEVLTIDYTSIYIVNKQYKHKGGNTVYLKEAVKYIHWGGVYERAEVGLLSRPILIQGDDSSDKSLFGGHLMMRQANISIYGVEFRRMGKFCKMKNAELDDDSIKTLKFLKEAK